MDQNSGQHVNENVVNNVNEITPKVMMHDPGWNDPPLMSYETRLPSVKKVNLNKRVAFPLGWSGDGKSVGNQPTPSSPVATPPKCAAPPPISSSECLATPVSSASSMTDGESLDRVLRVFENSIASFINVERDEAEIRKRLAIMKKMWDDGKLDAAVKSRLLKLVEALEKSSSKEANDIHIGLMVDFTGQCSAWMAGIKKLILAMKSAVESNNSSDICSNVDPLQVGIEHLAVSSNTVENKLSTDSTPASEEDNDDIFADALS